LSVWLTGAMALIADSEISETNQAGPPLARSAHAVAVAQGRVPCAMPVRGGAKTNSERPFLPSFGSRSKSDGNLTRDLPVENMDGPLCPLRPTLSFMVPADVCYGTFDLRRFEMDTLGRSAAETEQTPDGHSADVKRLLRQQRRWLGSGALPSGRLICSRS
jgi:hypothetical protein